MPSSLPDASAHKPRLRLFLVTALALMLGMHAWEFYSLRDQIRQGYPDFTAMYAAGKCVVSGLGSRIYDQQVEARIQQQFAPHVKNRQGPLPFTHPPFEAALFAPLGLVSYTAAYCIWNVFSLLTLFAFLGLLRPSLPALRGWSKALPILASLAFFPVYVCLLQGQDSLLLLLLVGLAFVAMNRRREFLAGACLGLALFRFQLVLPLLAVLLLRRRWKVLPGFAVVAAALAGVSVAVVGWQQTWNYPRALLQFSRAQAAGAMNPRNMPNVRGVVSALAGDGVAPHLLIAVISLALLGWAAWQWKSDVHKPQLDLSFALAVVVAIMASYHLMAHDLSLLLLPLLLGAEWLLRSGATGWTRWLLVAPLALLFFSPMYFLLWFRYQRFSLLFWAILLLAAGLSLALRRGEERQALAASNAVSSS